MLLIRNMTSGGAYMCMDDQKACWHLRGLMATRGFFNTFFIFFGVFMCFYIFLVVEALLGVTGHDI